jgi:MFS transporter, putative metabolite:H+ symporter
MQGTIGASILLAALGYFVDIYDLILFSIVRVKSLRAIGVPEDQLLESGVFLLNMQMGGMLTGGILWGILGDKKGRLSVLFGSIALYSLANIANGFAHSVNQYAVLRLIAGIGLAGELGAGITLVSEIMSAEMRGYGTMIVAGVGILGGVMAGLIGDYFDWRTSYFIGGGMGLALLCLRIGVYESGMFSKVKEQGHVERGNFMALFKDKHRIEKYLCSILIGVPIWFVIGILVTFSPEFGKALGMAEAPSPARAIMLLYLGCAMGDFVSGALSQYMKSRRKVAGLFLIGTGVLIGLYLARAWTLDAFYFLCWALGMATGYWAVFVTMASEQFGTNIRATVTTTVPNFVRGSLVPLNFFFKAAKAQFGIVAGAGLVGTASILLALAALSRLQETYGKDLNYTE